jgi:hypothetical protein
LLDLSRNGFQVKVPVPLNTQSPLNLRFRMEGSQMDLMLPGTIRWQRPASDGTWLAGCQTDRPIDWETLGELFLRGVLSTDRPYPCPTDRWPICSEDFSEPTLTAQGLTSFTGELGLAYGQSGDGAARQR